MHKYTDLEKAFMRDFIPGHTYKEIQEAFIKKFNWDITVGQIKGYMANHKINSGTKGHFSKGHVPANKGKKMTPEIYEKVKHTMFQKGHAPQNHRPVGSERVSRDGYIEIKVAEPDKWKLKHRVLWEESRGKIPKGSILIFVDGNKQNVVLDNLRLIERGTHAVMNHEGLCNYEGEFKDTAIAIAALKRQTSVRKKK